MKILYYYRIEVGPAHVRLGSCKVGWLSIDHWALLVDGPARCQSIETKLSSALLAEEQCPTHYFWRSIPTPVTSHIPPIFPYHRTMFETQTRSQGIAGSSSKNFSHSLYTQINIPMDACCRPPEELLLQMTPEGFIDIRDTSSLTVHPVTLDSQKSRCGVVRSIYHMLRVEMKGGSTSTSGIISDSSISFRSIQIFLLSCTLRYGTSLYEAEFWMCILARASKACRGHEWLVQNIVRFYNFNEKIIMKGKKKSSCQ